LAAVTYPNKKVIKFINENLIPLQLQFNDQFYIEKYNARWTPTIIIIDSNGVEHHKSVGFLEPEAIISMLKLGIGKMFFNTGKYREAIEVFNEIINKDPQGESTPEAVYLRGVSTYKQDGTADGLKAAYEILKNKFPGSNWTKRASPYGLL